MFNLNNLTVILYRADVLNNEVWLISPEQSPMEKTQHFNTLKSKSLFLHTQWYASVETILHGIFILYGLHSIIGELCICLKL